MDVEASPFHWTEVVLGSEAKKPVPRVYHAAEVCAAAVSVSVSGRQLSPLGFRV